MHRRDFLRNTGMIGGALTFANASAFGNFYNEAEDSNAPWFDKSMRWAQLAFVENDPGNYDPDFWLSYFKKIHADGVLLSAGGIVAFYPTNIPYHHRSAWMKDGDDPLGYLVKECRKMNMQVVLRTDPHATRQDMYDAHPDYIAVTADGKKRRHWANPELWVTCALGPYNFEFMNTVNKEIMERYSPEAIFSNRWQGHGICYCEHCTKNFKASTGLDLPRPATGATLIPAGFDAGDKTIDPTYSKWMEWQTGVLKEVWFQWDADIRKLKPTARFIPNGFPDKVLTGEKSDFFFADQQGRRGVTPPWANAKGAKELRASLGLKPLIGIFSVGPEEEYRWKDSVQSNPEIRIWVAEGVANGMKPCFVKFGAVIYDKRWMDTVAAMYDNYYKAEKYLQNTASAARVAVVYSEQTARKYGGKPWQEKSGDHAMGMYQALVEQRIPFDMVNDKLLDEAHLKQYKLLILPNVAALSDAQCSQLKTFVQRGGSVVATFETSLYDETGKPRTDFGLADVFGVAYSGGVEGPMRNSYLRIKTDKAASPVIAKGLENAYRIINTVHQVKVSPKATFDSPVTLIPTYPDLPMEDVFPRVAETGTSELFLREMGKGRVAYIPGDIDRTYWQLMTADHLQLLGNTIRWALNEAPVASVTGPGMVDVTAWHQKKSMTVHLVNLTNPMTMKGTYREFIPVAAEVDIQVPAGKIVTGVRLLMAGIQPVHETRNGRILVKVPAVQDHEIVALDFA